MFASKQETFAPLRSRKGSNGLREWRVVLQIRKGGQGKVPCLTRSLDYSSRGPVVLRDSTDRELRPLLHRLLGPPWPQSALVLRPETTQQRKSSQNLPLSNHFQQTKWLCNFLKLLLRKYSYTMVRRPFSRPLTSCHFNLKLPSRI